MTRFSFSALVFAFSASAAVAQKTENAPTSITTVELGDVKVRYLNFKWDEEAFEALEKGGLPDQRKLRRTSHFPVRFSVLG